MKRFRFPIRWKLTVATLLPMVVAIFLCWLIGITVIDNRIIKQAQSSVAADLNGAREIYRSELEHIRDTVSFGGNTPYAARTVSSGDPQQISALLSPMLLNERLDMLGVVDPYGRVLFRVKNPTSHGDSLSSDPLIARALNGEVTCGTILINASRLRRESPDLANKAIVSIRTTPRSRPSAKKIEDSALVLAAASPVRDKSGRIIGALYGGIVLNNTSTLVDRIRRIVYEGERFDGENMGSATIFLNDLRIATTVTTEDGQRALGTLMSEEVYRRVLVEKQPWIGRAFVVNDWYFTAYEPLLDPTGQVIGSLYVGIHEQPFTAMRSRINLIFALVLLGASLIGITLSGVLAGRLARPIRQLELLARRVTAGERELSLTVEGRDEIGELAQEFNQMTRTLGEQEREIRLLNRQLEQKVVERTAELEEKKIILTRTQEELQRATRLADLGVLAAGVAHEINNPMAIIRGNAELLQLALPEEDPNREEVSTIADQVERVERIVAGLLAFARQEEKRLSRFLLSELIDDILKQLGHQVPLQRIAIHRQADPALPPLEGDRHQLRQVFTNLLLNAIQAMPDGGTLSVSCRYIANQGLAEVTVVDTGIGINPADQQRIFNPFFTTKGSGTGLGLSISYGIVRDHGGTIDLASDKSSTTFRVSLPLHQTPPSP
ncbi:MAG TPA: cache domain-containing protein [Geobacterales bacterium]|nr:cache domain-containing protein [Geobacterales bacterium]